MNNYFVWFTIDGDIDNQKKSNYSSNVHNFLFENGIKLKTKSNAFFYKSDKNVEYISEVIRKMVDDKIKLIVISLNTSYQGWLSEEQWEFLSK